MLLALAILLALMTGIPCAIYVPTPLRVVRRMLALVNLRPREKLYDLGCGDGRILVIAAKEYGAFAVGVEVNPILVWLAKRNVKKANVGHYVRVIRGNLFNVDLREADVVTMYLSQYANERVKGKLAKELKPGARVVTYIFPIRGWRAVIADPEYNIYVYRIPESLRGF